MLVVVLTGHRVGAEKARAFALVDRLAEDSEELNAALELADKIATNAPLPVSAAIETARPEAAFQECETWTLGERLSAPIAAYEDAKEGPRAFREKRKVISTG